MMRAELARWSYKPGWSMTIESDRAGLATLVVRANVYDRDRPSQLVTIESRGPVPDHLDRLVADTDADADVFGVWLQARLFDVERHESREWLRRDGVIFDDPHRPKTPADGTNLAPAAAGKVARARTTARRCRWVTITGCAAAMTFLLTGLEHLAGVSMLAGWIALALGAGRTGWADGYEAAQHDTSLRRPPLDRPASD